MKLIRMFDGYVVFVFDDVVRLLGLKDGDLVEL